MMIIWKIQKKKKKKPSIYGFQSLSTQIKE